MDDVLHAIKYMHEL